MDVGPRLMRIGVAIEMEKKLKRPAVHEKSKEPWPPAGMVASG